MLLPLLNKKYFFFDYSSGDVERTMRPEFAEEVKESFRAITPLYRFFKGYGVE